MAFVKYNPNPENKRVGDCTIRALCKALNQDWNKTFMEIVVEAFTRKDMPSANAIWGAYLKSKGFSREMMPDQCPECYTVENFAADHPRGIYVLAMNGHVVCLVDGDWYDIWDSGDEVPLYAWKREG